MGIIIRQSIKYSIVRYGAILVGMISSIFIYPLDLTTYGLFGFLQDTALLLSPLILMGFHLVAIKFFPTYLKNNRTNILFWTGITVITINGAILAILYLFFFDILSSILVSNIAYREFAFLVIPLAILTAFMMFFIRFASNYQRIAVPSIFEQSIKLSLPIIFLLFYCDCISLWFSLILLLLHYIVVGIGLLLYCLRLGKSTLYKTEFRISKRIRSYAFLVFLSGLGSTLAFKLDGVMLPMLTDLAQGGEYRIALQIASVVVIPSTALFAISSPIVAKEINDENWLEVNALYKKSSINLLLLGGGMMVFILSITPILLFFMQNDDMASISSVILVVAGAKCIDMTFGMNSHILINSNYFRYNLYFVLLLAVVNIVANYILIKEYGPIGAAIATMIALSVLNVLKYIFIKKKFKLSPFSIIHLKILLFIIPLILFSAFYHFENIWLSTLLKVLLSLVLLFILIFKLKVSEDLLNLTDSILNKFKK